MPDDRDPYDDPIDRPRQRPWPDDDVDDDRRRRLSRRSDDDFGDDRRWGDQRDDYDDGPTVRARPEDKVRAPGTALAVVGWVGLAMTLGLLVLLALIGIFEPPPDDELIVNVIMAAIFGPLAIAYFMIMAVGGHRMRQCRSYGLAMTAGILAIASFALLGLCSLPVLPFGIWAVVVLGQSDVRKAFERRRGSYH